MTDERLQNELRSLPRRRAADGFTRRVLAALDAPEPSARPAWMPVALAGAASALAVALLAVALGLPVRGPDGAGAPGGDAPGPVVGGTPPAAAADPALSNAQRLLAELKAQHALVQDDWRTLRQLSREAEPVLYVGGTDDADMVLDLRRLEESRTRMRVTPAAVRRASDMTY